MSGNKPHNPQPSRAVEDYVKQIYKLTQAGRRATTKSLAQRMKLGQGTVSGMMKQLAQRGLVVHQPYYGATLTNAGHDLAMRMIRRHRLLELFLVKTLNLGWDQVDDDAERLEHAVSDELVDHIDAMLGHPNVDPHGAPIPDRRGKMKEQDYRALSDMTVGQSGRIMRVSDREQQFLGFLRENGLNLNAEVSVIAVGPFGSMTVKVGRRQTHLPREATERIWLVAV